MRERIKIKKEELFWIEEMIKRLRKNPQEREIDIDRRTLNKVEIEGELIITICPSCDSNQIVQVIQDDFNYCPNCGVKIKWSN